MSVERERVFSGDRDEWEDQDLAALDEEMVRHHVREALLRAPGVDTRHVDVEVHGRRVILRGCVNHPDERERLCACARAVPGVGAVEDQLTVAAPRRSWRWW